MNEDNRPPLHRHTGLAGHHDVGDDPWGLGALGIVFTDMGRLHELTSRPWHRALLVALEERPCGRIDAGVAAIAWAHGPLPRYSLGRALTELVEAGLATTTDGGEELVYQITDRGVNELDLYDQMVTLLDGHLDPMLRGWQPARLTVLERRIAALVLRGWSDRHIAAEVALPPNEVTQRVRETLHKLRVTSRNQLIGLYSLELFQPDALT